MLFLLQMQMMILLDNDNKILFLYMLFYISSLHIIVDFAEVWICFVFAIKFVKELPCQTLDWL